MKPSVLITTPDYDRATRYLSAWAQKFADEASEHGNEIYNLKNQDVVRKKFESFVGKKQPDVLFLNGHGAADRVTGHDYDVILDTENLSLVTGRQIYALSCQSGKALGKQAVAAGAEGYVGYLEDYYLPTNPSMTTHPTEDAVAALFLEPSNAIARALSKGHSAYAAAEKGRDAYAQSIRRAFNGEIQSDDDKYIPYLLWNRKHLVAYQP